MKEITIELDSSIEYKPTGASHDVEASFITIKEPNGQVAHLAGMMKSEINKASKDAFKDFDFGSVDEKEVAKEVAPEDQDAAYFEEQGEAMYVVMMAGGVKMEKLIVTFQEILKVSGLVGGEKTFTTPLFNRMAFSDIEKALKAYIGNFMAS